MEKLKILLIQEVMQKYRSPIYKILQEKVDLTLAYTLKNDIDDSDFKIIKLDYFKVGPLIIHRHLYNVLNQFDVVISQPHLSSIRLCMLQLFPRKFKLITWTIGKHATYNTPFDLSKKPSIIDWVYEIIQDGADACVFYMKETIEYWNKYKKIDRNKYFEAHNTVAVAEFENLPDFDTRDSFLFVGSLYAQKGLGELLDAYKLANYKTINLPLLKIVGKGPEEEAIRQRIREYSLENRVILCGAVYDETKLKDLFFKAVLCISPKQAGLSVPKSLGYGCPFVTRPDAITGGERDNVIDGFNGMFYKTTEELSDILLDVVENKDKYAELSFNARNYYINQCSPQRMADGVMAAIEYVLNS